MATVNGNHRASDVEVPLDLIKVNLNKRVYIKLRTDREMVGTLNAFDQHMNLILGDAEETRISMELDEETYEQVYKQHKRTFPMVFIRGDGIVLLSALNEQ